MLRDGLTRRLLKADGTVGAWGIEYIRHVPADLTNAVAIAAGVRHCLALRADGTVVAWGANDFGQTNVPTNLRGIVAIGAGGYHCMAVRADGTLVTWGRAEQNTPSDNVASVEGGDYHSLALRPNRTVTAWGWYGTGGTNVPAGLSNVAAVAAGAYHSLALRANGVPSAQPLTLSGFAETDLLIQLRGSDPDGDALRFFIRTLPGAGAIYQCESGARGAPITAPNTLVTDPAAPGGVRARAGRGRQSLRELLLSGERLAGRFCPHNHRRQDPRCTALGGDAQHDRAAGHCDAERNGHA